MKTMTEAESAAWERVREGLEGAKAIAWDACHKIYVLMDAEQVELMESYGYDPLIPVTDIDKAYETLQEWWQESCGLRFINAVSTVEGSTDDIFERLIAQGEEWDWREGDDDDE